MDGIMVNRSHALSHTLRVCVCFLIGLGAVQSSRGDVVVYQTGFEAPFVNGILSGQQGWSSVATIDSPAAITGTVGVSGTQGVAFTRGANAGLAADANYLINLSSQTFTDTVTVVWDMKVLATGATPLPFGPFFGIDNFTTAATTQRIGYVGLDATTGEVLYSQQLTGALLVDNNTVSLSTWHTWSMTMDFNAKLFSVSVDTVQILTGIGFVDPTADITNFVAAALTTFPGSGDPASINAGGVALFDNFTVLTSSPPLVGDLDGDGFVGITDLNIVLGNWNQNVASGDPLAGDPSGDGFVGIDDLNTVLGNWNAGSPPPAAGIIPEPTSLALMAVGAPLLLHRSTK